jgi:sugar lactone lactonase YvrE
MGTTIFGRVRTDNMTAPQHLWAIAYEQTAYDVQVYNLPLTPYAAPVTRVANTLPVLGGGSVTIPTIAGIYPDPAGTFLWIADNTNSRVLRVRSPLTAPVVDIILGQTGYSGTACNQGGSPSAYTLCNPGSVEMDHHGNLYVSDASLETAGNWRMLRWTAAQIPASPATCVYDITASGVFATGGNFNVAQSCVAAGSPPIAECAPFEPAFTSDDRIMVAGQNGYTGNRFPVAFSNPSGGDLPVSMLNDFSSMSYSAIFDNQDNLYITDLDRARMLIYFKPFPTPTLTPLTPMPTATFTCSPTPGCFQMGQNLPDQAGGFSYPMGVAVDTARHYIYAADSGNNRIQVYSYVPGSQPVPAGVFGTAGAGNLQFNYINSMVTDSMGYLYVADFNNGRVQKIWYDGVNATFITVVNQPSDNIGLPRGLYVTPDGTTVYITTDGNLVYRYDGGGALYSKTTSFGSGLNLPMGIVKAGNIIYVVDNGDNKIEYFTETPGSPPTYSAGAAVNTGAGASLMNNMFFMTTDKAGNIYVASANSFQLLVFQKMAVDTFYLVYNTSISNTPIAAAVDEQDDIYVSNGAGNKVVEVRGCFTENTITITPTLTATPADTQTFTLSPTATCTSTYTSTATPTSTQTAFTDTCTPTLTATLTPTVSFTATATPTQVELPPCGDGSNAVLYPDPFRSADGNLNLHLGLCFIADINVKIYTSGFRKIMDNTFNDVAVDADLEIPAGYISRARMASGIYYAAVIITPKPGSGFPVKKKLMPFVVIN